MQRLDELVLGQFLGLALDHDDLVVRADVHEVQVAELALGVGRVDDELAVDPADAHRADGAARTGMSDTHRAADAPLMQSMSESFSPSALSSVAMIWVS